MSAEFADPGRTHEHVEKVALVLQLRAQGKTWVEAAARVGVTVSAAMKWVDEEAKVVRAANQSLIDRRFLEHDTRLEWLYEMVAGRIYELARRDPPVVDEKLVRAAITILERQARLHGLDAAKMNGPVQGGNWLSDKAPIGEVLKTAKEFGIPIPEEFKVVAGV